MFELETQLTTLKQVNERLALESDTMNLKNRNLGEEIARLIEVDQELVKAKQKLVEAENELATKEFQVSLAMYHCYLWLCNSLLKNINIQQSTILEV